MEVSVIKGLSSEWGKIGGERQYQELNGMIRTGKADKPHPCMNRHRKDGPTSEDAATSPLSRDSVSRNFPVL
jgi:hypothetical protein